MVEWCLSGYVVKVDFRTFWKTISKIVDVPEPFCKQNNAVCPDDVSKSDHSVANSLNKAHEKHGEQNSICAAEFRSFIGKSG